MATQYLLVLENVDTFQLENGDDFQLDLGDSVNTVNIWKGAVEPAQDASGGNLIALWKGAVEVAVATVAPKSISGHISRRPRVVYVDQDEELLEEKSTEPRVMRMTQEVKDMIDRYRKRLN